MKRPLSTDVIIILRQRGFTGSVSEGFESTNITIKRIDQDEEQQYSWVLKLKGTERAALVNSLGEAIQQIDNWRSTGKELAPRAWKWAGGVA